VNVIISNFELLRRRKAAQENRDISIATIADETKLSTGALMRIKHTPSSASMGTIETLCGYFGIKSIAELIEYKPTATDTTDSDQGQRE
jgi:hypothetical protein